MQFARTPLLTAALLTLVLWPVFGNFIVAACVGLLAAFLAAMLYSLRVLSRRAQAPTRDTAEPSGQPGPDATRPPRD